MSGELTTRQIHMIRMWRGNAWLMDLLGHRACGHDSRDLHVLHFPLPPRPHLHRRTHRIPTCSYSAAASGCWVLARVLIDLPKVFFCESDRQFTSTHIFHTTFPQLLAAPYPCVGFLLELLIYNISPLKLPVIFQYGSLYPR